MTNNKMLHRRSSVAGLSSTMTSLPVLSTFILLVVQIQTFHALPTSSSLSNANGAGFHQSSNEGISASLPSTAYGTAYPYSSYRPGARLDDSYRPYSGYSKDSTDSPSGLYISEAVHPNSVYSRQSSASPSSADPLSQNLDKVFQLIEKEIEASDLKQRENGRKVPLSVLVSTNDNRDGGATPEHQQVSLATANNNTPQQRNNKPRLLPLPSIRSPSFITNDETNKDNTTKQQQQKTAVTPTTSQEEVAEAAAEFSSRSVEFSPNPPPFAPELDPLYEKRQYGLGALTLLDQAGPFW